VEQAHIAAAFRFELSKVTVPAIRQRVVSMLRNVSEALAAKVAEGLNISPLPEPMPRAIDRRVKPEVSQSPPLSLMARPGDGSVKGRKVAVFVADGCVGRSATDVHTALFEAGAVPRFVAPRIGPVATEDGVYVEADASLENEPAFLFDALVLPDGAAAVVALSADGHAMAGIRDQFRHCKTILALGVGADLLDIAGVPRNLADGEADPGITLTADAAAGAQALIHGLARHRHPERETDPPRV
jgi:catalase